MDPQIGVVEGEIMARNATTDYSAGVGNAAPAADTTSPS
jgi:hypothetical protein